MPANMRALSSDSPSVEDMSLMSEYRLKSMMDCLMAARVNGLVAGNSGGAAEDGGGAVGVAVVASARRSRPEWKLGDLGRPNIALGPGTYSLYTMASAPALHRAAHGQTPL